MIRFKFEINGTGVSRRCHVFKLAWAPTSICLLCLLYLFQFGCNFIIKTLRIWFSLTCCSSILLCNLSNSTRSYSICILCMMFLMSKLHL
jgi:hypothetical protein